MFSSVAGERGRKPVVLYGAAKAGLTRYLEGLDHRFHATGLRVICVKPGFVKTSMTSGLRPPPFAGEPEQVAVRYWRDREASTGCLRAQSVAVGDAGGTLAAPVRDATTEFLDDQKRGGSRSL